MLRGKLSKGVAYANARTKKKDRYNERRASGCCVDCGKEKQSKARCDGCAAKLGTKSRWLDDGTAKTIASGNGRAKLGEETEKGSV